MKGFVVGCGWILLTAGVALSCGSGDESSGGGAGTTGSGATGSGATGSGATTGGGGAAAGAGGAGTDGGGAWAGGSGGAAGTSAGGGGGQAGADCTGTHPLVDGGVRFCDPGQCRCIETDRCLPQSVADTCCKGERDCFTADGGVNCKGTHPLVDGSDRFCEKSVCYCKANDSCYPAAVANTCCEQPDCG